jgi:CRP-like cAMP-binding protein
MVELSWLKDLIPTRSLTPADRSQLAKQGRISIYKAGQTLFERGDAAKTLMFLLEGEVKLENPEHKVILKSGTPEVRHALSPGAKRAHTATALKPSRVLLLDRDQVDLMLTWSQAGRIEVSEADEVSDDDWVSRLLNSPSFTRIPPANIAQMIASMEALEFKPGEPIIKQGDAGDFYYIVTSGQCVVERRAPGAVRSEELARLGVGEGFGEEALVSGEPRSATVSAIGAAQVARLSKLSFQRLIQAPLLREIVLDDVPEDAHFVDVRLREEFVRGHLPEAVNLPLRELRRELGKLNPKLTWCVYCDTGRRSAAGAYLLSERGFNVMLIKNGVTPEHLWFKG